MCPQFTPFLIALEPYGFERIRQSLVCWIQNAMPRIYQLVGNGKFLRVARLVFRKQPTVFVSRQLWI